MDKYISRTKVALIYSLIAVSIFSLIGIYLPMGKELEKSLINNFSQNSHSKYHSTDTSIKRGIEGAVSLSSRTMIKNIIVEYKSGTIGLESLKEYTQPKYEDGAKAIEYIIRAERVVGGDLIAEYGKKNTKEEEGIWYDTADFGDQISQKLRIEGNKVQLVVISPIIIEGKPIGHDCVLYDLKEEMAALHTGEMEVYLINGEQFLETKENAIEIMETEEMLLLEKDDSYYATFEILEGYHLVTKENKKDLLEPIHIITFNVVVAGIGMLVLLIGFIYFYLIRYANKRLQTLESSRNSFRELAYRDELTGAYSRTFLKYWNTHLRSNSEKYGVVMIDVDDFKKINDELGHLVGDEILGTVASILEESIRRTDYLVRYGGDEFVLLLPSMEGSYAKEMMHRIDERLLAIEGFPWELHISYGIGFLKPEDTFEDVLHLSDTLMYQSKKGKKM